MKTCSYCGAEYPDDAVMCSVDHTPFASPAKSEPESKKPNEPKKPEYRFLPIFEGERQKDFVTLVTCATLPAADVIV